MENAIQKTSNELKEWWDILSIKAEMDLKNARVDIYDMLAMISCLKQLDLLREKEETELEF